MLYLNSGIPAISAIVPLYLTLTSVVFELAGESAMADNCCHLTLTSVVFESLGGIYYG